MYVNSNGGLQVSSVKSKWRREMAMGGVGGGYIPHDFGMGRMRCQNALGLRGTADDGKGIVMSLIRAPKGVLVER